MLLKNVFRIIGNVRYVGPIAWAGLVSMIAMELIILALPKLAERVVHSLEIRAPYETVLWWCYALAGASALYIAVSAIRHRITDYAWGRVFVEKTLEYKKGLLAINYATLLKYGTGKLISRFSRGIDAETDFMYRALDMLVAGTLRLVVVMIIIGLYSPWLAAGFLAFLVLNGAIQLRVSGYFAPLAQELEETFEEDKRNLARIATENFLIRTSNRADYETVRAGEILDGYPLKNVRYEAGAWGIFYLLELGFRWVEALAFAWLGWYVLGGTLPLSTIPMMGTYIWLAWDPIANFLTHLRAMSRGYESYLKMRQVLDAPEVYSDGTEQYRHAEGTIELREVTFGYSENITVLDRLSMRIAGGQATALVGHSGSGKSTVMKLLLRIYDPSAGEIDYDGQDLRSLSLESVYRRIGYLPQEPAIFDGTVRENLAYATTDREFSDHELWQALADARLDERIKQFETGLDTEIGERGVKLSGGERQRLAIARIFLKNPDIILLDEPTSALDSISEKIIGDLLVDLSRGKTVVIIAHRLQTVMHADTIYVMDHGRIKEQGTHAELLAAGGTYAELVDLQTGTLRE